MIDKLTWYTIDILLFGDFNVKIDARRLFKAKKKHMALTPVEKLVKSVYCNVLSEWLKLVKIISKVNRRKKRKIICAIMRLPMWRSLKNKRGILCNTGTNRYERIVKWSLNETESGKNIFNPIEQVSFNFLNYQKCIHTY